MSVVLLQAQGIIPAGVKPDIAETENDAFRPGRSKEKRPRASDDGDVKPDLSDLDVDGNEDLDALKVCTVGTMTSRYVLTGRDSSESTATVAGYR